MAIWTPPAIFSSGQLVNKTTLNTQLAENLRFLHTRPRDVITLRDIGSFDTTSTSLVAVSTSQLRLSIEVQAQADLMFWLNCSWNHNSTGTRTATFDIKEVGGDYLSSGTGTALSSGIAQEYNGASTSIHNTGFQFVVQDVLAGSYSYDLYYATNASTLSLLTNPTLQFGVMEI